MPVGVKAIEIRDYANTDKLADQIVDNYIEWEMLRTSWMEECKELRNYLFATDSKDTSASHLPWKNTVHIPKLCQIRDNLHANYMAAIFPHDRTIKWEGDDDSAETKQKRKTIQAYIANKIRTSKFKTDMSKSLLDWIDYGNCFGMVEYLEEKTEDPVTGEEILGYVGPKFTRISPHDITFNPLAADFIKAPKIIRTLKTLASLKAELEEEPQNEYLQQVFTKAMDVRRKFHGTTPGDYAKHEAFAIDGFGSYLEYLESDYVELLHFYGDIYDRQNDKLYKNYHIVVMDRGFILKSEPADSWLGHPPIFHVGWRLRPDNLYAMGPLDNLIGMQHRIDHLENAKADAFDLIIFPVQKVRGVVEDYDYGPGERIYVGDEGDVEFMRPDTTFLNADTQIAIYEQKMEEMAGAPKQAMGFRTPGEKTAFEVQILENGANKVFINKSSYFEEMFIEPILNSFLELSRRMMGVSDILRSVDEDFNIVEFRKITREDITAKGKIRPIGARHFARNANLVQNLTQFMSSPLGQDPGVRAHMSGVRLAQLVEELLDLERFDLVQENVQVQENIETQRMANAGNQILNEEQQGVAGGQTPENGQPPPNN